NLWKTVKQGIFVAEEKAEALPLKQQGVPATYSFWHAVIERRPMRMLVISLLVVSVGGAVELIPTFLVKSNIPTISTVKPYTPLELQGRDIYIR
ncbi:cbb3-type cytochrome c oxidase subunit II, partial [Enterococcus faecium]